MLFSVKMSERSEQLRQQILALTAEYHAEAFAAKGFVAGSSAVPVSGKVIDAADMSAVVESALDGWFTTGRWAKEFERKLARFVVGEPGELGVKREPGGAERADLAQAGCARAQAGR